ncbi:MAG: NTP transferase domain-containing protein [Eubacterium sp.]|nr:NTP transferase domain-containing protein [Eubacterium sp.]
MNGQEKELLLTLNKITYESQRVLAEHTGLSLGKVNKTLKLLQEQGYIDEDNRVTLKARKAIKNNSPKNAIILAAGFGMRMVPINTEVSKGLLKVKGESLVERIIKQLREIGVYEITIVVGYLKESYEYLIDQYGVNLVINMDYATKNNLYSLNKVVEKIGNTYIIPCDVYCEKNPFSKNELYSWYMVSENKVSESYVKVNRKNELVKKSIDELGSAMLGISYVNLEDSEKVQQKIYQHALDDKNSSLFWEDALFEKGKMVLSAKVVNSKQNFEINTFEQLREIDENSEHTKSDIIKLIADVFQTNPKEIKNITVLKKGMTNRSFEFSYKNEKYIMRIPGKGTDMLINRRQEYEVYESIKNLNLCDEIFYINPDNGYKITKYIHNAKVCDDRDWNQISECMDILRDFHEKNLKVNHSFDLYEKIEFYESLWEGESCFKDYNKVKASVYELKAYIDKQEKHIALTHIDANADNFLISNAGEHQMINLIDWEYAAMQDTDLDIAMFAIYSMYNQEEIDKLIDIYCSGKCSMDRRMKIYAYIAVSGLLWSNWCEYKRYKGEEFGEYSIAQYRFAKEYSKKVINYFGDRDV